MPRPSPSSGLILQGYIEPTSEDRDAGRKIPTKAHFAIADLVHAGYVRVILTTNFDRLLENALRDRGVEPTVIDSLDSLKGAEPLTHTNCHLVKLHGDYKDIRICNTEAELAQYKDELNSHLDRILDEHGLVVCGWSGDWDEALRSAILRSRSRRYSLYWAARNPLKDRGNKIITQCNGKVIRISNADDFLDSLHNQVQNLTQSRLQSPWSLELQVKSAKRFASRPEHAIELHDLFETETKKLLHLLDTATPQVAFDSDGVQSLCGFYESVSKSLACMFGVVGRWGNGNERNIAADAFLTVWNQASGADSWRVLLQRYPAILVLWSYGTCLTLAKRWPAIFRLLSHPVGGRQDDQKALVELLYDWFLSGSREGIWKRLPELERLQTPAEDHLFDLLDTWRGNFAAISHDFEAHHDMWEFLVALAYCDVRTKREPVQYAQWFQVPIGRIARRLQSRQQILQRLADEDIGNELIRAGFCGEDMERLTRIVHDYLNYLSGLVWLPPGK